MGRKRVSKKSKRSWRKHANVADVEEYLEDARAQERTGGLVVEKSNDALFFVDKGTEPPPAKRAKSEEESMVVVVKPTIGRVGSKRIAAIKPVVRQRRKKAQTSEKFDLWTVGDSKPSDPIDEYYKEVTKKKPVKAPSTRKLNKPLPVAAVKVAESGASYNPSFRDHQTLLMKAAEDIKKKLRREKAIQRKARGLTKVTADEREAIWLKEMAVQSREQAEDGSEEEEEEEEEMVDDPVERNAAMAKLKTKRQRRKAIERQKADESVKKEKKERLRMQDVYRIKTFKREIREKEEKSKERQEGRKRKAEENKTKPKRLGYIPYEEPPVIVQLPEELSGSLRKLKPKGSVAFDRYDSLLRRCIIEPRRKVVPHRRYPLKYYTKKGHREEDFDNVDA